MNRRFHTDSRTSENFTESGLVSLTGQAKRYWGRYIVKELLDNALESSPEDRTPEIAITIGVDDNRFDEYASRICVRDNGPGIPDSRVEEIFADPERFGGTKRHYALPTRGNQGNALMTLLGIQHVCGDALKLDTNGRTYRVRAQENAKTGRYEIEVDSTTPDGGVRAATSDASSETTTAGTAVTVELGDRSTDFAALPTIEETIEEFVALNPHATFEYTTRRDGEPHTERFPATTPTTVETLSLAKNATTGKATWFTYSEFEDRLLADYRADSTLTIREFVSEFCGVSSRSKVSAVLDGFDLPEGTLGDCFDDGRPHHNMLKDLYSAMCAETSTFGERSLDSTLGSVGEDLQASAVSVADSTENGPTGILNELEAAGVGEFETPEDLVVRYADGAVIEPDSAVDKTTPFVFELAAVPFRLKTATRRTRTPIAFGINQSVSYSESDFNPLLTVEYDATERSVMGVSSAFGQFDHDYYVVANLTCPNIDFQDKGKQQFDTAPFHDVVEDVVGKAVRKIERDIRPRLNELVETPSKPEPSLDGKKAPQDFCQRFVRDCFDHAYADRTNNGETTITMRQLFYVMRPMFHEWCEGHGYEYAWNASVGDPKPPELKYETFTNNIAAYEEDVLGERVVYRNKRGFFAEPHSNTQVPLGTASVKQYSPDLEQYGALLFIEKTGFFRQLHEEFELSKRYDVGLINAQGMSTTACRDLIEKIQSSSDEEITLYTLTDFDAAGVGIASNASDADELSTVEQFDTELLGLRLSDVKEYDLGIEPGGYNQSTLTELQNKHEAGVVNDDEYEFLAANGGQRVEINAFAPIELKKYLERRFEELGIEKVTPDPSEIDTPTTPDPDTTRTDSIEAAVGGYILNELRKDAVNAVREHDRIPSDDELRDELHESDIPTDDAEKALHKQISERLAENPPERWSEINRRLVDDHEETASEIREEYEQRVNDAVRELLDEHATVSVTIDLPTPEE